MTLSPHRAWSFRAMDVLVATAMLISGACHHQSPSAAPQPGVVEDEAHRFPGVDIVPTAHSGFLVRIRGGGAGGGEPLYVIDGEPMVIPSNRGIDWFTPEQIAEIKVLKYPHELVEYGPKGVNGVVLITTKQNPGRSRKR